MNLSTPIEQLSRIGFQYQKKLKKLGIKTIADLIFHFPHRYEDFSIITPISKLGIGKSFCIRGKILEIENFRTWKRRMILTQALIQDKSGAIKVIWFNQPYLINVLRPGEVVSLAGKTALAEGGLYFSNPAYEKMGKTDLTHTGRLVPIYPETEGLSSRWLRYIIKPLLVKLKKEIVDPLPEKIIKDYNLLPIEKALWQVHFPDSLNLARAAQQRFSFEELFFIGLLTLREKLKLAKEKAIAIPLNLKLIKSFANSLPFKLTDAQKRSAWQILKDLEKPYPMNRLLEGEVGSGKTVVATLAALNTIKAGYQVAFMAPTEILAKQHFKTVSKLLNNFKINIGLLTGKEDKLVSKKLQKEMIEVSRSKLLEKIKNGEIDILIGTHALIQDKVKFGKLALVILDEQHRFGVEQRAKLLTAEQKAIPHLLSMTATPIPRTLALTIYGDLDLSLINELPKGRKKIITKVISPLEREKAYNFIRKQVKKGRQVFVICPRIESPFLDEEIASEKKISFPENKKPVTKEKLLSWAEVKAVKEEYQRLAKKIFPDLKVGMLHGKLATKEKEKIMEDFKNKKIDILVSTSVVEVGIDIPNATLMVIEGAERFGLSQLHQFRGRVGRADHQSYCFLLTDSPAKKTHQRLKALLSCENGFELAKKDLEIRGPGDFSGTRQWGIPDLIMDSLKDLSLVEKTRQAAEKILEEDWELKNYPLLKEKLEEFHQKIHLE